MSKFKAVGNLASASRSFYWADVIGQRAAKDVLIGMFAKRRIRNAFLFSGVPGIGKTTLARILATVLNCENVDMKTYEPCGECDSCKLMMMVHTKHTDYQEIDCGANGTVDNARRIGDFSMNRPKWNFRVIVLDEAQNLTGAAQDALLKNLEHPKEHVIYCLCTTEPQKLRDAVRSRCVDIRLDPPTAKQNVALMRDLALADKVKLDDDTLLAIAAACMNRTRDCVNTLGKLLDSLGVDSNADSFAADPARYVSKLMGLAPWVLTANCVTAILTGKEQDLVESFHASENKVSLVKSIMAAMTQVMIGYWNIALLEPYQQRDVKKLLKHCTSDMTYDMVVRFCDEYSSRVLNINRYEIDAESAALPYLLQACRGFAPAEAPRIR